MTGVVEHVRAALGDDVDITGWIYRLLSSDEAAEPALVHAAAQVDVQDRGNLRVLLIVDAEALDPVEDCEALHLLNHDPAGARLAYEVAVYSYAAPLLPEPDAS
jgi:hypothetical protein